MNASAADAVQSALDRGELLCAYDLARTQIEDCGRSARLTYQLALALARMGDNVGALAALESLDAGQGNDEDSLALRGRILKDLALQAPEAERGELFARASDAYLVAHRSGSGSGSGFALINAATTAMLGGLPDDARAMATEVLTIAAVADPDNFYAAATAGEAQVLLGDYAQAARSFALALTMPQTGLGMRATASRQLAILAQAIGDAQIGELGAAVRPPPVVFFAGNMFHADPVAETRIAGAIDQALLEADVRVAYGGAAAGADILFAEAVLRRGGELNIVLPFAEDDYLRQSVKPWGEAWEARFAAVTAAAKVTFASDDRFVGDPAQFAYGSQVAMGLACLRAQHLSTRAVHLALCDPAGDLGLAGTGSGIDIWRQTGREVITIDSGPIDRTREATTASALPGIARETRSIIFTDYAGFSKLDEAAMPLFIDDVLGRIARTLNRRREDVIFRNTWGDALFAVIADPQAAAELALAMQEDLKEADPTAMGLSKDAGMRISLHHGPIYRVNDPVTGRVGFFGVEVTRAARIEPITPIGQVYATEPFAALLALQGDDAICTRYAGALPLAKRYGTMPMHRLERDTAVRLGSGSARPKSEPETVHLPE